VRPIRATFPRGSATTTRRTCGPMLTLDQVHHAGRLHRENTGRLTVNTFGLPTPEDWCVTNELRSITMKSAITAR
jgi:hypothetical protein